MQKVNRENAVLSADDNEIIKHLYVKIKTPPKTVSIHNSHHVNIYSKETISLN